MYTRLRASAKPASMCASCLAWGVLPERLACGACRSFNRSNPVGRCTGCRRIVAIKEAYCRLCWHQAALLSRGTPTTPRDMLAMVEDLQLFLADLQRFIHPTIRLGPGGWRLRNRKNSREPERPPVATVWLQEPLFLDSHRDYTRFQWRRHADLDHPQLARACTQLVLLAQAHGWSPWIVADTRRALVLLLSGHLDGETISYSQLRTALQRRCTAVDRTAQILDRIGLLHDDRVPGFETWPAQLIGLSPGIRCDVEDWVRTLCAGGPRSRRRSPETAWGYLERTGPILTAWSQRVDHLREITRADLDQVLDGLDSNTHRHLTTALRSLFRHCKKTGTIFHDPAARIPLGKSVHRALLPLDQEDVGTATEAATTPAARVALVLAAVHAARSGQIRALRLDAVDMGNRRLTISGRTRPIEELTHQILSAWLEHRRNRWPHTANPYLLINANTALRATQVSKTWVNRAFRNQHATLQQLRVDRQLGEALAVGPDPLHLATLFGLDEKTAIRYAQSARQLLVTAVEHADPSFPHQ